MIISPGVGLKRERSGRRVVAETVSITFVIDLFAIASGEVLAGELRSGKTRLLQAWVEIHRDELLADWQLAVNGEAVFKIDPLK